MVSIREDYKFDRYGLSAEKKGLHLTARLLRQELTSSLIALPNIDAAIASAWPYPDESPSMRAWLFEVDDSDSRYLRFDFQDRHYSLQRSTGCEYVSIVVLGELRPGRNPESDAREILQEITINTRPYDAYFTYFNKDFPDYEPNTMSHNPPSIKNTVDAAQSIRSAILELKGR